MKILILALLLTTSFAAFSAGEMPVTFNLAGRLYDSPTSSDPLLAQNVELKVQILDAAKACILYEEKQVVDTDTSDGHFAILVGSSYPSAKRGALDPQNAMATIFQNSADIPARGCAGNLSAKVAKSGRYLRVIVTPNGGSSDTLTPEIFIGNVPMALVSETLGGLTKDQFLQLKDPATSELTQSNLENIFSSTNYPILADLMDGTVPATGLSTEDDYLIVADSATPGSGEIQFAIGASVKAKVTNAGDFVANNRIGVGVDAPSYDLSFGGATNRVLGIERRTTASGAAGSSLSLVAGGAALTGSNRSGGDLYLSSGVSTGNQASRIFFQTPAPGSAGSSDNTPFTRMALDGDGQLGIGNSAPVRPIHISSASAPTILLDNTAAGSDLKRRYVTGSISGDLAFGKFSDDMSTNTEHMRILSDGKVGIGLANPGAKLEIQGASASSASPIMKITTPGNLQTDSSYLTLNNRGSIGYDGSRGAVEISDLGSNKHIVINTSGAERLRVDGASGNVGIGTNAPVSKLHVGTAPVATDDYGLVSLGSGPFNGTTAGFFTGHASGTVLAANAASGFLGDLINMQIGGVSKFKVDKDGVMTSSGNFSTTGNITQTGSSTFSTGTGNVSLNGATSITNTTTSTSSSTGSLIVSGGAGVSGDIYSGASVNAATTLSAGTSLTTPQIYGSSAASGDVRIDGSSNATKGNVLLATAGGNVGIGTTTPGSTMKLDVNGNSRASLVYAVSQFFKQGNSTATSPAFSQNTDSNTGMFLPGSGVVAFSSLGTERARIDSTGRLGIGISPSRPLDVSGTIRSYSADGSIEMTGGSYPLIVGVNSLGTGTTQWITDPSVGSALFDYSGTPESRNGTFRVRNKMNSNSNTVFILDKDGNAGIGSNSPVNKLEVNGALSVSAGPSNLTTLTATVSPSDTTINVASTGEYPSSGVLFIYTPSNPFTLEVMSYTGKTATTFTGVTRALYGTSATTLNSGFRVDMCLTCIATNTTTAPSFFLTKGSGVGVGAVPPGWLGSNGMYFSGNARFQGVVLNNSNAIGWGDSTTQIIGTGSGSTGNLTFRTNSAERVRIDSSGNIGIGTSAPTGALDVQNGNNSIVVGGDNGAWTRTDNTNKFSRIMMPAFTNANLVTLLHGNTTNGANSVMVGGGTAAGFAATQIRFLTASNATTVTGTDRFIITGGGNLGVGTTNPFSTFSNTTLSIVGAENHSVMTQGLTWVNNAGGYAAGIFNAATSANAHTLLVKGAASTTNAILAVDQGTNQGSQGTSVFRVQGNGNVGVGVLTATAKLQVAGTIAPDVTASKDIGSTTLRWNNIFLSNNPDVSSDVRLKDDIQNSDLGLSFVNSLRPVSWTWKNKTQGNGRHYGVIAQEAKKTLEKFRPGSSRENVIINYNEESDSYSVRYSELISPLIKAIQELFSFSKNHEARLTKLESDSKKLKEINEKMAKLESENSELKARLDRLERSMASK